MGAPRFAGVPLRSLSRLGYEAIQAVPALSAALKHGDARSGRARP